MSAGGASYGPGDDWSRIYGATPGGLTRHLFGNVMEQNDYNDPAGYAQGYGQVVSGMANPDSVFAQWLGKQFDWLRTQYATANAAPGNAQLTWTDFLTGDKPVPVAGEETPATQANARQTLTDRYLALPGWQQGRGAPTAFSGPYLTKYGGG